MKLKIFGYVVAFFAVILALNILGHVFGVIGQVAAVPGKVLTKTLETDNVIASYEWFYDTNAAYDARLSQVVQYKTVFKQEEDREERSLIRSELMAMQQTCRELATKYNANSEKMNKSVFKGWSLPPALSIGKCN